MAVADDLVAQAIHRLAHVSGIMMDPRALAEDAALLAASFPDEVEFLKAVLATERAMADVAQGRVTTPAPLVGDHAGWNSYHYQHRVAQGQKADMRLEWRRTEAGVFVRAFGHRFVPADFYRRVSASRPKKTGEGQTRP